MRVPFTWLSEFIELDGVSAEEVADRLSLQSVEALVYAHGVPTENLTLGRVLEVASIKDKEGLISVNVITGKGSKLTVVTSDTSVKAGDIVIVAPPGARIDGRVIEKRKFGNVISEGMLISAQELGMEDNSSGVIKIEEEIPLEEDVRNLLGLGEPVIELDITPNRGDVLSIKGIARDISALLNLRRIPQEEESFEEGGDVEILIQDVDCKRYRGAVIKDIKVGLSPLHLRKRLWQCGVKSINNIVDVTNYILLREGQPLHAFDLDKLSGEILVRSAKEGERLLALDSREHTLDPNILVIADSTKPVAIAGVIGGLESSVMDTTRNILLEAAYFNPPRIRKASKKLGVQTDSSYRFERNVDISSLPEAQNRAIAMILKLSGGSLEALRDVYPEPYRPKKLFLSAGKYERYSGEAYEEQTVKAILEKLDIPCSPKECGVEVEVPAHRSFDFHRDVDIIEEIMRVRGYDSYRAQPLSLPATGKLELNLDAEIRKLLRDKGLHEVINISFEDGKFYEVLGLELPKIEIVNPLVPTHRFMRTLLLPSLLRTALYNLKNYNQSIPIFEIGKVYKPEGERTHLGILLSGIRELFPEERAWSHRELLDIIYSIQNLTDAHLEIQPADNVEYLHPYVSASIYLEGNEVGVFGKLSPRTATALGFDRDVYVLEIEIDRLTLEKHPQYKPFSKFPPVIRDLAILVDKDVSVLKLLNEIKSHISGMVDDVMVFDFYTGDRIGEGKKSIGIRLVLRRFDRSLTDEEVNEIIENLVRRLGDSLGAVLR